MEENKTVRLPVVLKGSENYLLWARTAKAVLCGKKLWSHVESSKPSVVEAKEGGKEVVAADSEWFNEDQSVLAILHGSLSLSVLEAYSYCEGAKEFWDTLKNVFGNVSNLTRVFEVKKALNSLSQGDMEFNEFFGKFRSLWAELEMLRPTTLDVKVLTFFTYLVLSNLETFWFVFANVLTFLHVWCIVQAKDFLEASEAMAGLVDPELKHFNQEELEAVCEVASECLNRDPTNNNNNNKKPSVQQLCETLESRISLSISAELRSSSLAWAELALDS